MFQPDVADLVRLSKEAVISLKLDGTIAAWNPAAARMFGYSAEEIIGQSISKLAPANNPIPLSTILERIRLGETIEDLAGQGVSKDGQTIEMSWSLAPIHDETGKIAGVLCVGLDVSLLNRLQRSEQDQFFLAALISSADDAIIGKDLEGIVTSWNAGAERIFGYTAEEMIGQPVEKIIPKSHADEEPQILKRICRGERIAHYESERVCKDGRIIDVSLTISPIRDHLGRIIGASKIARDVTEKKGAEIKRREILLEAQEARREAEEARKQAEEASRAKDEFLAGISHELRTPMTAILGWNRMLLSGQLNADRQQKAFETIDRNARSQAQLIEDLLDVSRIISGKLRVDFKPVDMIAVITSAVEAVRPAAESKGIRVVTSFPSGAALVFGDAERLQQVIWNLLSNAIKFSPSDGSVHVELVQLGSQVEVRVIDNGIGIRPAFLPHVFDRFSQADTSMTRSYKGLGMGLAIVKSLVELHGGIVSVCSPGEGQGSVFTVTLPMSTAHADVTRLRPAERPALQKDFRQREDLVGLKILIVDDEPDTCEMLKFVFHECGSIVKTVQRAEAALDVFDLWQPDMLISDIGMPDVDGYDLIRTIRNERKSQIPAVALTAMARIDDRLKALAAGYQMHVAKPVEPVELVTIVAGLASLVNRPQ
jgi:PAS domain S-box-containing protein